MNNENYEVPNGFVGDMAVSVNTLEEMILSLASEIGLLRSEEVLTTYSITANELVAAITAGAIPVVNVGVIGLLRKSDVVRYINAH